MLEVSRNAAAAEEEQLVSCAAEKSKYCSIYTVTLDPYGDLCFNGFYAASGSGAEYRCGALLGGGVWRNA